MTVLLEPGTTVAKRYRLHNQLGGGAFSIVYRATDAQHPTRPTALKVLRPDRAKRREFIERFRREARVATDHFHPNVLTVWDSGYDEDTEVFYIAMPRVRTSLADVLEENGPLDLVTTIELLSDIAWALDSAHPTGIVHRDVKPENILLDVSTSGHRYHPYLGDFGIARDLAQPLTGPGISLGTPAYMPLEQYNSRRQLTGAADQYALAATFYCCLTGWPPYGHREAHQLKRAKESSPPPPLPTGPGHDDLDSVLAKALAREPNDRYDSCQRFIHEAAGAAGFPQVAPFRTPVEVESPSEASTVRQSARTPTQTRRRLVAAGVIVALLLVSVVVALTGNRTSGRSLTPPASEQVTERLLDMLEFRAKDAACHPTNYLADGFGNGPARVKESELCVTAPKQVTTYFRFDAQTDMDTAFDTVRRSGTFPSAKISGPMHAVECPKRGTAGPVVWRERAQGPVMGQLACAGYTGSDGRAHNYRIWTTNVKRVLAVLIDFSGSQASSAVAAQKDWVRLGVKTP